MNNFIYDAIKSVYPKKSFSIEGTDLSTLNMDDETTVNVAEIQAEITRLQAEHDAAQYARNRVAEYPSIGDQLDALFHAGVFPEQMAATIQAVKDAHPKPTEGDA